MPFLFILEQGMQFSGGRVLVEKTGLQVKMEDGERLCPDWGGKVSATVGIEEVKEQLKSFGASGRLPQGQGERGTGQ